MHVSLEWFVCMVSNFSLIDLISPVERNRKWLVLKFQWNSQEVDNFRGNRMKKNGVNLISLFGFQKRCNKRWI